MLFAFLWFPVTLTGQTTDFESFSPGTVNYQLGSTTVTGNGYTIPDPYGSLWTAADEWGFTAPLFDEEVKDDGTGNMVWRFSNALISGGFSNQPNSPSSAAVAGESTAFLYNDRGPLHTAPVNPPNTRAGATTPYFHGGFRFKSATGAPQPGLFLSINPVPRQSSYRMSYIGIEDDGANGFDLIFYETTSVGGFVLSNIAADLSYTDWHQVDIYVEFVDGLNGDGSGNDIVTILVNGVPVHTGTTWESFFALTSSFFPFAVDALLFRAAGTAAPGTSGNGIFFDDVTVDNAMLPPPAVPTLSEWGLIILVLLMLSIGTALLKSRQLALRATNM
jgi:hypothetical protein